MVGGGVKRGMVGPCDRYYFCGRKHSLFRRQANKHRCGREGVHWGKAYIAAHTHTPILTHIHTPKNTKSQCEIDQMSMSILAMPLTWIPIQKHAYTHIHALAKYSLCKRAIGWGGRGFTIDTHTHVQSHAPQTITDSSSIAVEQIHWFPDCILNMYVRMCERARLHTCPVNSFIFAMKSVLFSIFCFPSSITPSVLYSICSVLCDSDFIFGFWHCERQLESQSYDQKPTERGREKQKQQQQKFVYRLKLIWASRDIRHADSF